MPISQYLTEAEEYAEREYALDANAIEREWHNSSYHFGISPQESVDAFALKYDLTKREDFSLEDALGITETLIRSL